MARFTGPIKFVGSVGGLTSKWDDDIQDYVLSSKKEKNKNHNKHAPRSLEMNSEFTGVTMWSKFIRRSTSDIVYLKKGRLVGLLNRIGKRIQLMDGISERGTKQIESSRFNFPLIGFCFNTKHPFKDVFHVSPEVSITDDRREVTLRLTDFTSFSAFNWNEQVGYYRVFLQIFELPDLTWSTEHGKYDPMYAKKRVGNKTTVSSWMQVSTDPIDFSISAAFKEGQYPVVKSTVVVVMGLEFASGMDYGTPYVVKDHGTAAVLACL